MPLWATEKDELARTMGNVLYLMYSEDEDGQALTSELGRLYGAIEDYDHAREARLKAGKAEVGVSAHNTP